MKERGGISPNPAIGIPSSDCAEAYLAALENDRDEVPYDSDNWVYDCDVRPAISNLGMVNRLPSEQKTARGRWGWHTSDVRKWLEGGILNHLLLRKEGGF